MNNPRTLWAVIAVSTATTLGLLFAVTPACPHARVPWLVAAALGLFAGAALFTAITRSRPRLHVRDGRMSVALGRVAFFGLWATNEEVFWRRVALGELLSAGMAPAFAVTTVGFALVHRSRRLVHLGTGSVFASVYLGTGALVASVAAHWVYNVLVGGLLDHSQHGVEAVP
jgi:membrane protease YdiL (CAAX protease family)